MTPRESPPAPRAVRASSFQRFRADAAELSDEEQAFWDDATLLPIESHLDAKRLMFVRPVPRPLLQATSGGGFLVPTDLAAKTIAGGLGRRLDGGGAGAGVRDHRRRDAQHQPGCDVGIGRVAGRVRRLHAGR